MRDKTYRRAFKSRVSHLPERRIAVITFRCSAHAISSRQIFITVTQHIPDKRFQMVRYYGWYSNNIRGQRRRRAEEEAARESAATAEQECGAGASAAIEIIEHRESKPRRIPSRSWRELIKLDHEGLGS